MSAAPGHPILRARVARALAALLAERAHTALGESLGCAGTTVSRRGDDLHAWPADDLLALAAQDQALGEAVVELLTGETPGPAGSSVRAVPHLLGELAWVGEWTQATAAALADGRITPAEARALQALLRAHRPHLAQLDADLTAIAGRP